MNIERIFFDVGTTLIDETKAYDHRIREAISGTDITFEQFSEKRRYFAEQNLRGDIEAINYFGLQKTRWHKEDEIPYGEGRIKFVNSSIEGSDDAAVTDTDDAAVIDTDGSTAATSENPSTGVGITVIVPAVCLIAAAVSRRKNK